MKLKEMAILGQGKTRPKLSPDELTDIRRHVISGDWSAINAGICTLADLGLRHSGSGLVWLRSGVSVHQADYDAGVLGKDKTVGSVNGLPLVMVRQWTEYWTKQSFAVSVPTELRRQYYPDDAAFGKAMREAGYVPVRTRKLTGKLESFWLYRVTGNNEGVCTAKPAPHKASRVTVQASETERFAFTRVAVDGRYLWVYDDHIRYLKKIRTRIGGKQVQGYSAKNSKLAIEGAKRGLCADNKLKSGGILPTVQAASTKYTPAVLASMAPAEILAAAKDTLIAINGKSGVGMVAHSIMLKHGGRNLASVPQANLAECLSALDKLLNLAQVEVAA